MIVVAKINDIDEIFTNLGALNCDFGNAINFESLYEKMNYNPCIIYYNGIFNSHARLSRDGHGGFPSEANGFVNISTDALLNSAQILSEDEFEHRSNIDTSLDSFHYKEMHKQATFSLDPIGNRVLKSTFQIRIPESVHFAILHNYLNPEKQLNEIKNKKAKARIWEKPFWEALVTLASHWLSGSNSPKPRNIFIYQTIAHSIFQDLILHQYKATENNYDEILSPIIKILSSTRRESESIDSDFYAIIAALSSEEDEAERFAFSPSNLLRSISAIDIVFQSKIETKYPNIWSIDLEDFSTLLPALRNISPINQWYQLDWRDMSSGEKSVMSFLSRVHHETLNAIKKGSSHLFFLLDEPEIGMHPQWQKKLLSCLIDYFEEMTKNTPCKVQIILTTNQPILVSDFPRSSVCFLEYNSKTHTTVCLNDDQVNNLKMATFGANISDILGSSFFLSDGYVADFSANKIKQILSSIKLGHKINSNEVEMIDSTIIREYITSRRTNA